MINQGHPKESWGVSEAAVYLGRSKSWIYQKISQGEIPFSRLPGGCVRFDPVRLRKWLISLEQPTGTANPASKDMVLTAKSEQDR